MNKRYRWQFWARALFWSHVIGVVGFYLTIWFRTRPNKKDRLQIQTPKVTNLQKEPGMLNGTQALPFVSIIVPARNEEQNIYRCVTSLLEQDYENYEVVVVDDGSTDRTSELLDELQHTHVGSQRLWVLRLRDELPEGWAGKPHAIHSGVRETSGNWLLLTDADTWHAPTSLRSAITQAISERADLFTLSTKQELPKFWDRVLMPMAYMGISMLYPPREVNDPNSPTAIANGQYILIRRSVYDAIGGYAHPDLRQTLLDDRDLAQMIKSRGFSLRFVDGSELVSVYMYKSLDAIWRGWRKNAYLGNRGGLAFVLLELIGLPMISVVPFVLPLVARLMGSNLRWRTVNYATLLELTPLLAYRFWLNRQLSVSWYYALTHPLAGALFTGILGDSTWNILTGKGVDWSGRQYHNNHPTAVPKPPIVKPI